ncbi:MAG: family 31 glucosidase [Clostridiales bacterium]|nr:family 31 glucosidase [Clostridiales bacterium]
MRYFERTENALIWKNRGETLMVSPWGEDSFRVRSVPIGEIADDRFALLEAEETACDIEISDMKASIRNGRIRAEITVDNWHRYAHITFMDADGRILLEETEPQNALALRCRLFEPQLGGDYALTVTFKAQDEHIYGMGQYQEETIDWKMCTLELAHRNSQASVPFYVSDRGYGFLWHNPSVGEVSFAKNRTTWKARATRQMDYWICAGETPARISYLYAKATGFAPEMPEYGLGFWQSKLRYFNQEQLLEVAREYKRRGLPIDVIVCDFFHWPRMGDYRFDERFFPDPDKMVAELKEMGIELMVSVWPQISLNSENYQEMNQQGLLVRAEYGEQIGMRFVEDSMFFDATNPAARKYVWEKVKKNYYDKGIRIFWLDEAEPEWGTYDFGNYRYYMGSNLRVGNLYPQYFARCFWDGMKESGLEKPVNLLRCAWAGSQRYGALVWSGDIICCWEDFRKQLCAGIGMGYAGIPWWTTDIGGFHFGNIYDEGFRELLVRWFEWGTYCPVMRIHGDRQPKKDVFYPDGRMSLDTGNGNEVWSFGDEVYEILKKYLFRREELRPYVRKVMENTHRTGAPVMRGMYWECPDDPVCREIRDQYFFGDRYLVAPVMEPGKRKRNVYIPGEKWQNIENAEVIEGPEWITADAPLDVIPVFMRIEEK